jgi:hypothetical protein
MTWLPDNSLACDSCENVLKAYGSTVEQMLDLAIVARWGLFTGVTEGGTVFHTVACKWCREDSHKRVIKAAQAFEDTPLWEQ